MAEVRHENIVYASRRRNALIKLLTVFWVVHEKMFERCLYLKYNVWVISL